VKDLTLQPIRETDASLLWEASKGDASGVLPRRDEEGWMSLIRHQEMAETLGEGLIRAVCIDGAAAGFVILNKIPPEYLIDDAVAVECGTYLLPAFRGRGINPHVKRAMVALARETFDAEWCVFVVPLANCRALSAMHKLPWPLETQTVDSTGRFRTYLRRKVWETSVDCVLYAVRTSAVPESD
jgi:RimJ/RimL family protein N-acetyltransferase